MFVDLCMTVGPFIRQYVIVILVNLSMLGSGLGLAWTSPVLVKLSNETTSVLNRTLTEEEGSWVVSVSFVSGFLVNFLAAYLVDQIGRKYCFILAAVPRLTAYIFLINATQFWMLLVGRLLVGVADAFTFTVVPMYSSEVASKEIRGGLGTLFQIFSSLGIVTMLCIGPFLAYVLLNKVVFGIVLATTIPLLFLPDSPYFLYSKGKTEEALKVLNILRGSPELALEEIKEYQSNDAVKKPKLSELLRSKTVLKAIGIIVFIGIGSQLTGFNAVAFYLQTILVSTKTSVSSETASVVIGLIQLFASFCTALVIDKFGRKPILSISLVGVAVGMLGLGVFFCLADIGFKIVGFLNFLPLISLILVVYCFSAGLGSLQWLLMAELFDGQARALGMFFGLVSSVVFVFLTTKFFAPLTTAIGPAPAYWAFSINCVILCIFILYCVPETKGKTFSEIQAALDGKSNNYKTREEVDKS